MVLLEEIYVPGCIECRGFEEWWKVNSAQFPNVKLEQTSALDQKGQEMVLKYQIFSSPGIMINGEVFSTGGVDFNKLTEKLKELNGK